MIDFESENGDVFIDDCTFEMGTSAALSRSSRVSGGISKAGSIGTNRRQQVCGWWHRQKCCDSAQRSHSLLFPCQSSFSECRIMNYWEDDVSKHKPVPEDELIPEPAALELWRFNRECYRSRDTGRWESYKLTMMVLSENRFCENMRAP